jgi:thiol-disulfide isomerase/thioredoxin
MKLIFKSFLLSIIILIFGCSNERESMTLESVIVAGKILNQDNFPDNYTIKIFENNLVSFGNYHTAFINDDGSFKIKFDKSFSSDVYLMYGSLITLFVSPGDSIFVEMDANEVLNPNPTNRYEFPSLKFSGSNEQINNEIKNFIPHIFFENPYEATNKEKTLQPDDYLNYLESVKTKQNQILDSLIKTKNYSDKFIKWSQLFVDYRFASNLYHYTWFYPHSNNTGKRKFEVIDIPESFYKAIEDIPIANDEAVMNSNYPRFLHEYFLTNTDYNSTFSKNNRESRGKFRQSDLFQDEFEKYLKVIIKEYDGIASEILISQKLYSLMDSYDRIDIYEKLYPEYKNFLRESFCDFLDKKYTEKKLEEQSPEKNKSLLKENNEIEIVANDILKKIIDKNKGKVILLDFWATWCGPCLMEFEHSKKLAKTFKEKDIEFVYLCVKSKKENWEDKIREYNLSGSHYLLDDSEYDILSQKFQIVGIPHYVLIGKVGKIINRKAPNPSSREQLTSLIDKYIDEK